MSAGQIHGIHVAQQLMFKEVEMKEYKKERKGK